MMMFTELDQAKAELAKSKANWLLVDGEHEYRVTSDEAEVVKLRAHLPGHVEAMRKYGRDESEVPM